MPKPKQRKTPTPVRFNVARVDASVGSIVRRVERDYGLPAGSVALVLKSGRRARSDKRIGALLKHWGW